MQRPRRSSMRKNAFCLDNKVRSPGFGGLALLLLLGAAGCVGEGDEDITEVTSALVGPNGHTQTFVLTNTTYLNASQSCINSGMHLATINNATEDAWIFGKENDPNVGGG